MRKKKNSTSSVYDEAARTSGDVQTILTKARQAGKDAARAAEMSGPVVTKQMSPEELEGFKRDKKRKKQLAKLKAALHPSVRK